MLGKLQLPAHWFTDLAARVRSGTSPGSEQSEEDGSTNLRVRLHLGASELEEPWGIRGVIVGVIRGLGN